MEDKIIEANVIEDLTTNAVDNVTDEEQEQFVKDTEENTVDCTNDDEPGDVND